MAARGTSLLVSSLFRPRGRLFGGISRKALLLDRRPAGPQCHHQQWLVAHDYGKKSADPDAHHRQHHDHPIHHRDVFASQRQFVALRSFCSEVRRSVSAPASPFHDEGQQYPPLPEYGCEQREKEHFIVQAKGLPWSCTAEDLSFFSECKIHGGVNGIHMIHNKHGQPSGKAFIELQCKEDVRRALRKNMHYLGHRYVEVQEVTDSDAENIVKASVQLPAADGVVKLRGLPFSCTVEDIVHFFEGLDIVGGGVTLVFDAHGRNTGIAYVEFASQEMADQALQKDRERIGSRYIEIFPSRKSAIQSHFRSQRVSLTDYFNSEQVSDSDAEGLPKAPEQLPTNGGVVKIQGLPYSATEEDVIQFFAGLDIAEDGVTLVFDRKGRSTGIAYVEFTSQEMAAQALEKHRETMGSRYIEVFPSKKSGIRSGYSSRAPVSPVPTMEGNTDQATQPDLHPQSSNVAPALGSTNIPSITQHCVHVRGLPFCASGQDIVNFFSPLQLAKICIEYGPDGRASGEADVYFTCHEDAVLAMSRDKACIGERYIELFLNSPTAGS
ncbi:heterogeneous nuclear ribonucleoprotein F-like [Scleropages formosus]|uniref:heterogeneous nuclear ribonucleoprotein F-like n=1 Tax=Scleropages formosus TaxID=113540 RepID=UPI0010FA6870|nr:heterogeneous nuclear ribonucleoprotein F-like [Scleropages formosus]